MAGMLQHGTAKQQSGLPNSSRVRGGNRRGKGLWKRLPRGDGIIPCAPKKIQNQTLSANL
jgi:hypothetical protein